MAASLRCCLVLASGLLGFDILIWRKLQYPRSDRTSPSELHVGLEANGRMLLKGVFAHLHRGQGLLYFFFPFIPALRAAPSLLVTRVSRAFDAK